MCALPQPNYCSTTSSHRPPLHTISSPTHPPTYQMYWEPSSVAALPTMRVVQAWAAGGPPLPSTSSSAAASSSLGGDMACRGIGSRDCNAGKVRRECELGGPPGRKTLAVGRRARRQREYPGEPGSRAAVSTWRRSPEPYLQRGGRRAHGWTRPRCGRSRCVFVLAQRHGRSMEAGCDEE